MEQSQQDQRTLFQKIFISPEETRLRAGWRLLIQSLLLGVFLVILGFIANQGLGLFSEITYIGYLLLGALATSAAVTISVYLARRLLDRRSFASLGLKVDSQMVYDLLFGIGLTGLMMGLIFFALWALNWLQIESFAWQFESWGKVVASVVSMTILLPSSAGRRSCTYVVTGCKTSPQVSPNPWGCCSLLQSLPWLTGLTPIWIGWASWGCF
jgi:hypothetical protein